MKRKTVNKRYPIRFLLAAIAAVLIIGTGFGTKVFAYDTTGNASSLGGYDIRFVDDAFGSGHLAWGDIDVTGNLVKRRNTTSIHGDSFDYMIALNGGTSGSATLLYRNTAEDANGTKYDVRVKITDINAASIQNGEIVCIDAGMTWFTAYNGHTGFDVKVEVLNAPANARILASFVDFDVPSTAGSGTWTNADFRSDGYDGAHYDEGIQILSGTKVYDNTVMTGSYIRSNPAGTRFWGSQKAYSDPEESANYISERKKSGIRFLTDASGFSYRWYGPETCGTGIQTEVEAFTVKESVFGSYPNGGQIGRPGTNAVGWHQEYNTKVTPAANFKIDQVQIRIGSGEWQQAASWRKSDPAPDGSVMVTVASAERASDRLEENRAIRVSFVPDSWKIETEVVNGTIDPDILEIPDGEDRTVHYAPDPGYLLSEIVVDGTPLDDPLSRESSYPFRKIHEDHKIRVVYVKQGDPVKSVKNAAGADIDDRYVDDGADLYYVITVSNPSNIAYEYTVTDKIPAQVTFVSADHGGKEENGTITWKVNVAANSSEELKWQAKAVGKGVTIRNKADMTVKNIGPLSTNTVTNYTPKDPGKDVRMNGASIDRDMRVAGDEIIYAIELENIASGRKTFHVTDPIPAGLSFVAADHGGENRNGVVTWDVPLEGKQKETVTWTARIEEEAKDTVLINNANYTVEEAVLPEVPEEDRPETPVLPDPVKEVTREIDGERVDIHQLLVSKDSVLDYTITWHNPANDPKIFTVTDRIPEHTALIDGSVTGEGVVDEDGRITWTVLLEPKAYGEVHFSVMTLEKDVHIPNNGNVAVDMVDLDTNEVENWIPRQPVKTVLDEKGEEIEFGTLYVGDDRLPVYQIDYHNNSTLTKVYTITDVLPEGLVFVSAENDGVYDEETRTITWQDTVGPDETRFVRFSCQIDPEVADTRESIVDNIGIVSSDLWEDEEDERIHIEVPLVDIPVQKIWEYDPATDPMLPGSIDVTLYEITEDGSLRNPKDLTLSAANNWAGAFRRVPAYADMQAHYIVREKNSTMEGYVSSGGWASEAPEDGFIITNRPGSTEPFKDVLNTDGISINGQPVEAGETLTYTITWQNCYDSVVDLQIVDPIPDGTTYAEGSADHGGVYVDGRREVQYQIPGLQPGEAVTVTFAVTVDDETIGEITNQAKIRSDRDRSFLPTNPVVNIVYPDPPLDTDTTEDPTPEPTPEPMPEPTPEPTPELTPALSPEPTTRPTPTVSPAPQPTVVPPARAATAETRLVTAAKTGDRDRVSGPATVMLASMGVFLFLLYRRWRRICKR